MASILAQQEKWPRQTTGGAGTETRELNTGNRYNQKDMCPQVRKVRWFWIPLRVLLVTFLLALLSFAVCLFLGIIGLTISAAVRGIHPNLTLAYRVIAFPAAMIAGLIALVLTITIEFRDSFGSDVESH
jgi:hypothetical protein